jgi:hypothetical protein
MMVRGMTRIMNFPDKTANKMLQVSYFVYSWLLFKYLNCLKDGLINHGMHIIVGVPRDTKGATVLIFNSQPYSRGTADPNDHNKNDASTDRGFPCIY